MGVIANRGLFLPGMPLSARAWVQVFLNGMAFPLAEARTRRMRQCVPGRPALAADTHAFILSRLGPR